MFTMVSLTDDDSFLAGYRPTGSGGGGRFSVTLVVLERLFSVMKREQCTLGKSESK